MTDLDTPVVLIDLDRAERNLKRGQELADRHGIALRPHIKTHKLVRMALLQLQLGAVGITCQKLGEAEVMADAGIADILITYNILGPVKLERLKALHERARMSVVADSMVTVEGYARTFEGTEPPLPVLVECDTGGGRCGVQTPDDAVSLAREIATRAGLRFGGLMTYPGKHAVAESRSWLARAIGALTKDGLAPPVVSTGGTPDFGVAGDITEASEYRPGTYIYLDRSQVEDGVGSLDDCALTVLSTVVSRPTEDRAIIDAGSKALTSDLLGMEGFGAILEYPDAAITALSEEHGTVDLSGCARRPEIGEIVRIVPNHACPVTNLFDEVVLIRGERVVETVRVDARGRVA